LPIEIDPLCRFRQVVKKNDRTHENVQAPSPLGGAELDHGELVSAIWKAVAGSGFNHPGTSADLSSFAKRYVPFYAQLFPVCHPGLSEAWLLARQWVDSLAAAPMRPLASRRS